MKNNHYIDNKKFSQAVHDYVVLCDEYRSKGLDIPPPSNYIGLCFIKLCEHIATKRNFSQYTWKEDMILDGIENCTKAILNFDVNKLTRSGNPNAYGYFSLIAHRAFLRRIAKEKRQQEIRQKYIAENGLDAFADGSFAGEDTMLERMKHRAESMDDIFGEDY